MTSTLISASTVASFTPNNCANLSQKRSQWTSFTADNERRAKRQGLDHSESAAKFMRSTSTSVTMSSEPARTDDDNEEAEDMNKSDLVVQSRYSGVAQEAEDRPEDSDVKVVSEEQLCETLTLEFFILNVCLTPPVCYKRILEYIKEGGVG